MEIEDKVRWMRLSGRVPHAQCKTVAGVLWECISYPYANGDRVDVMIREPGNPTTLRRVDALLVHPGEPPCLCAEGGEFYFTDPLWMKTRREREVTLWEAGGLSQRVAPNTRAAL